MTAQNIKRSSTPFSSLPPQASPVARLFEISLVVVLLVASANTPGSAQANSPAAPSAQSPTQLQQPQAPSAITGIAFRDKNSDGKRDAGEPGMAGIVVTAFGADGTTRGTANTASDGSYSLAATGAGPYRVEFTNYPLFMHPGPQGPDSGTSVQFVPDGNATNINVNFVNPGDFVGPTVNVATTLFVAGTQTGTKPSLVGHPYAVNSPTGVEQFPIAYENQLGTTYGLAYQRSNKTLYAAAFTKRGTGFGPGGIGAIYKVPISGTPSVFVDIGSAAGAFTKPRDLTPDPPDFDSEAITLTGKSAFGDLDITEDETTLYTVNLANRSLYKIDVKAANAAPGGMAGVTLVGNHPDPGCVTGVARPFALEIKDGVVYVGGMCTGELGPTSGNTNTVEAYVYTYTAAAGWGAQPVLRFPMSYPTTCADVDPAYNPNKSCNRPGAIGSVADWWSWADFFPLRLAFGYTNTYTFNSETEDGFIISPEPILSDIEIDGEDMILGIRDRFGDQAGWDDPGPGGIGTSPFGADVNMRMVPKADILRASPKVTTTTMTALGPEVTVLQWQLEANASGSTFGPGAHPNDGSGPCSAAQGPNGENCGEFYDDNFNPDAEKITGHDEVALGSLAQVEGAGEVVTTAYDPFVFESAGTIQMSRVNGARVRGFQLYVGGSFRTPGDYLNKANGMGDLEVLTEAAPVELGNLVWRDSNSNGLQDPGESGIAGVTVSLFRPGVGADCVAGNADDAAAVAKAVTDAKGEYYFRTGAGPDGSQTDSVGLLNGAVCGMTPFATYAIKLDNATDFTTGQPLGGLLLTEKGDAVASPGGSNRSDSDAMLEGTVPVISYTLGGPGGNDHRLDFGFYQPAASPFVSVGNLVWIDDDNDGAFGAGERGVDNVAVQLYCDSDRSGGYNTGDALISNTQTSGGGLYLFSNLTPTGASCAGYIPVITGDNFCTGKPLAGYANSSNSVDGNSDLNNRDHGIDGANIPVACNEAVSSKPVSVTVGTEPSNDGDTDTSSNLTLDFGFYIPASLGNRVWFDKNKDGQQGSDEDPVPGVTVTLRTPSGQVLSTTVTGANGLYSFTRLPPGSYVVCFQLPPDRGMTTKGPDAGSDTDSNANPETNCTDPVSLRSGQNNPTLDVGIIPTGPTAVRLMRFAAIRQNGGTKIVWTTGSEINTFGFALYRAEANERSSAVLVTSELIAAKGASDYAFLDATAAPDKRYYYWLIETETSGAVNEYGPTQTDLGTNGASGLQTNAVVVAGGVPVEVRTSAASDAVEVIGSGVPSNLQNPQMQNAVTVVAERVTQSTTQLSPQPLNQAAPAQPEQAVRQPQVVDVPVREPAVEAQPQAVAASAVESQAERAVPMPVAADKTAMTQQVGVVVQPVASQKASVSTSRPAFNVSWIALGIAILAASLILCFGTLLLFMARRRKA